MSKKIAIVMPVANEEDTIENTIKKITSLPYENLCLYLIMDSYSKDKTFDIANKYISPKLKIVFYKESKGVASCYLKGFEVALNDGCEHIIEMDAGGSHNPDSISFFIEKLNEGYECVWGSRIIKGGKFTNVPLYRQCVSRGGTFLANLILGTRLKDMTSGYEAFQSHVLYSLNLNNFLSAGHMYQTEMRFYCKNFKSIEIPITYVGGKSCFKLKSVIQALGTLFKLKKNVINVMK